MPFGNSQESQRDSAPKPRVSSRELPWENCAPSHPTPTGLRPSFSANGHNPTIWGWDPVARFTQGSLADSVAGLEVTIPLGLRRGRYNSEARANVANRLIPHAHHGTHDMITSLNPKGIQLWN